MKMRISALFIILLLIGAAGCDLEVQNLNQPETERVLASPADLEALISGSFNTWWNMTDNYLGIKPILSAAALQHSPMAANFGMIQYSQIPRPVYNNLPADGFASYKERTWYHSYRAISAASDGIRQLDAGTVTLAQDARARAFAKLSQGVAHGTLALLYDEAVVFDETKDPGEEQSLVGYMDVLEAALGYLEQARQIASANTFSVPGSWIGNLSYDNVKLAQLANSFKGFFRANVPRTTQEAAQVNWGQVIQDIDNGITDDWSPDAQGDGDIWFTYGLLYLNFPGAWSQIHNTMLGMADQSGAYQAWMGTPLANRQPFLIITPDQRFPQGADLDGQSANAGMYIGVGPTGGQWVRADRGTWRWSYYRDNRFQYYLDTYFGPLPNMTQRQLQLIKAEALYRTNQPGPAADIVNQTRVDHGGLAATDAGGTNTDCVPKLPDGSCGSLLEMLKWEYRLETYHVGIAAWYLASRRWGDLAEGTILHMPVPGKELEVLQKPIYTYGGVGGQGAAPRGTYGY